MGRHLFEDLDLPTALSSMMPWALVFAADMAAGVTFEPKNLRRNEMLGNGLGSDFTCSLVVIVEEIRGFYVVFRVRRVPLMDL